MKIAIDIKALKNGNTGISRYLRSLMESLQRIDSENEYFLFECKESNYNPSNSKWKKICTSSRLPGIFWQQIILPFLLWIYKIDVLWAPEQICPIFLAKRIKVITTIHDFVFLRYPKTLQLSNLFICKLFFKPTLNRSSCLVPVSSFIHSETVQYLSGWGHGKQMETVTNGAPKWQTPTWYNAANRNDRLFFAGNLEPRKNLEILLCTLELLCEKIPQLGLDISGPQGWKNSQILRRITEGKLKRRVRLLGYLSEEELIKQYLNCKALVFPSFYEGFGLPVIEALKMDTLVLTSKNTVMEENLGNTAIYFDPFDKNDIAEKIRLIYKDDFRREKYLCGKNAVINKFNWDTSALRLRTIFEGTAKKEKFNPDYKE